MQQLNDYQLPLISGGDYWCAENSDGSVSETEANMYSGRDNYCTTTTTSTNTVTVSTTTPNCTAGFPSLVSCSANLAPAVQTQRSISDSTTCNTRAQARY